MEKIGILILMPRFIQFMVFNLETFRASYRHPGGREGVGGWKNRILLRVNDH